MRVYINGRFRLLKFFPIYSVCPPLGNSPVIPPPSIYYFNNPRQWSAQRAHCALCFVRCLHLGNIEPNDWGAQKNVLKFRHRALNCWGFRVHLIKAALRWIIKMDRKVVGLCLCCASCKTLQKLYPLFS